MRKIITIISAAIIFGSPVISLAQECGGLFGARCAAGETCMTTDMNGNTRPANVAINEGGTCQSSTGPSRQTPPPSSAPAQDPDLPVWYGTEDKAPETPKSSFLSWLAKTFLPQQTPDSLRDQCANPNNQYNCTLANGKKGYCSGVLGGNKKCMPWTYAQTPQTSPQNSTIAGYAMVNPETYPTPCITGDNHSAKSNNSKNTAACAPRNYCVAGPLFDHEECAKPITARYQAKIDKIAADLKNAAAPIQNEWGQLKDKFDLNGIIQNCINKPRPRETLDQCYTRNTNSSLSADMSAYLKQYAVWIRDTSAQDRDAEILSQCGDPRTLKCDRYEFGCPSVCTTDPQTGAVICSD